MSAGAVRQWFARLIYGAAFGITPQTNCPIPSGAGGFWMDGSGVVKLRSTSGADLTIDTSGSVILLAKYKTATALPTCTYANGTAGVGATLTGNSNGAIGTVGGGSPAAGEVVFVDSQVSGLQNGLYLVIRAGSVSTTWQLRRLTSFDQAAEMKQGTIIIVQAGTYANRLYLHTTSGAITVGTTALTFAEPTNVVLLDAAQTVSGAKRFAAGTLKVDNAGGTFSTLFASNATAARTATLPDKSGTVAFTDDLTANIDKVLGFAAANIQNNTYYLVGAGQNAGLTQFACGVVTQSTTKVKLDVQLKTAPGVGQDTAFAVYKSTNGGSTWTALSGVTTTISGTATDGHSGEQTVSCSEGDLISIRAVASTTAATAGVTAIARFYN